MSCRRAVLLLLGCRALRGPPLLCGSRSSPLVSSYCVLFLPTERPPLLFPLPSSGKESRDAFFSPLAVPQNGPNYSSRPVDAIATFFFSLLCDERAEDGPFREQAAGEEE